MIHYSREKGIDDVATHMEFLTDIMSDIKTAVFPNGSLCDSMLYVHNNNLFASDKIVATYLANGGPVPNLFHENIFKLIGTENITDLLKSNELEKYFVPDKLSVTVKLSHGSY